MRLYLIRHAETVDNVAGLYAGVRDSKLTVHGTEQAARLGDSFARDAVHFTHIFSSPLTRTVKTAEAIAKAQKSPVRAENANASGDGAGVAIVKVPQLIEQNFGYYEGKPFHARTSPKKLGRESDAELRRNDANFVDVESRESMGKRADLFLDEHLLPLSERDSADEQAELCVAIVSHGMLLSNLWRRLLLRLPKKSLSIAPEVTAARGALVLEHLGGWSNTGYLELTIRKLQPSSAESASSREPILSVDGNATGPFSGCSTVIVAVDSKAHLVGLKRQRGGIGRLAHDEGQKKLDGFFSKKPKIG